MKFLSILFGCTHRRTTFPQGKGADCHVSCLECGREFDYSWQAMRVGQERSRGAARVHSQLPDAAGRGFAGAI